jgi:hypothetical protein
VRVYFRTNITRMTFRELWGISSRLSVFLHGCVRKIVGVPPPLRHAHLHEDEIRVTPVEHVSDVALRALTPFVEEFERLGARFAFYHTVSGTGPLEGCAAVLLPAERNAVISVTWARSRPSGPGVQAACVVSSHLRDGCFLGTSNRNRRFDVPPEFRIVRCADATPSELLHLHQERLAETEVPALPVEDEEQAQEALLRSKRRNFEWNVQRGVWVPLTAEERVRLGLPVDD